VLTDPTKSEEFRTSSAWKSPLLDFQLRVRQTKPGGPAYLSNSLSGNERNRLLISKEGSFHDRSLVSGIDCREDARSFSLFDYDQDGWVDIALASTNAPRLRIFRNQFQSLGGRGRSIRLNLTGTISNRDAIGAFVTAHTNLGKRAFQKSRGEGLSSQNSPSIFIGLTEGETIEKFMIRWPSGNTSEHRVTDQNGVISITE
jgi:hypothetical protein